LIAVALFLLGVFPAISKQVSWHPPEKLPEQYHSANEKQEPPEPDKRGTPGTPLVVKTILPEKSPEETANDTGERDDKRFYDRATVGISFFTFIILCIQAGVFWIQADRLKQTIKKMDEIATGQTKDMGDAIKESSRSASAMEIVAEGISRTVTKSEQVFDIQKDVWKNQIDVFSAISKRSGYITTAIITGVIISGGTSYVIYIQSQQTTQLISIYNRLADTAEDAQRAWVGPSNATAPLPVVDQGIKVSIFYTNTGREAAKISEGAEFNVFSKQEWINGAAVARIEKLKDICMSENNMNQNRIAYPTTGFGGYQMTIDTANDLIQPNNRFITDKGLLDAEKIITFNGCFVYFTGKKIRHSSFCFFYHAKQTVMPNLNICTVGNASD